MMARKSAKLSEATMTQKRLIWNWPAALRLGREERPTWPASPLAMARISTGGLRDPVRRAG